MKYNLNLFLIISVCFLQFPLLFSQNWAGKPSSIKGFVKNHEQFNHLRTAKDKIPFCVYDGNNEDYLIGNFGFTIKMREIQFDEIAEFRAEEQHERGKKKFDKPGEYAEEERKERRVRDSKVIHDLVTYEWIGANPDATMAIEEINSYYHSYWYTNASGEQVNESNISSGNRVVCKNIYPGIDVVYEFHAEGGLKYSLIVHPGANIAQAQLKCTKKSEIDSNGSLLTKTRFGNLVEHAPVCYYTDAKDEILPSHFTLKNGITNFSVTHNNTNKTLIIDPWIQTPTFNTNWDCVWECDRDAAGNIYVIGGVMPMQLIKYNPAGVVQWTYNTPYDTTNWMGTMATDLNGNTYVTQGTEVAIQKVNSAAAVVWNNPNPGSLFSLTEFWSLSFNCDQTKLIVGGTGGAFLPVPFIYEINTTTGAVTSELQVTTSPSLSGINAGNEVRSLTSSENGRYYYLTHDTIGFINQNLNACGGEGESNVKTSTGYVLGYKCENFRASNSGIQAIKTYGDYLYINRGDRLEQRAILTGNLITTVAIPAGSYIVTTIPFFGTSTAVGNSGIDIDTCGNIFVGSTNGVYKFDQSLSLLSNYPTSFKVYDVVVSTNGNLIACGSTADDGANVRTGGVQSFAASACTPPLPECCNAALCEVPGLCINDAPFQLSSVTSGGLWSGPGVSASGLFNPASVGEGVFEVTYQLPCGSETVSIVVNNCSALSVCLETNGTYTVAGGSGPYVWEYYTPSQNTTITNQAQCVACGYTWLIFGCFNPFPIPAESCTVPEFWTEYANGTNTLAPSSFPARVVDAAGTEYLINSADEIVPCTECLADTINLTINSCEPYTNPLGIELTQSGIYTYTFQNTADCDSIVRINLTINSPTSESITQSICSSQLPYNWNGIVFSQAGVQSVNLQSVTGCDSLVTLDLNVAEVLSSTTNQTICTSQLPYTWNGVVFNGSGNQNVNLQSFGGCDSVATLILEVVQQYTSSSSIAICDVQLPFTWNGVIFNSAGSQSVNLFSIEGCDSVATLNLSVNNFVPYIDVQTVCESLNWINGNTYTSSTNTPVFTLSGGSVAGCDSVITLNLTVNQNASSQQNINACGSYQNDLGQIFNESGSYNFVLPTSAGCDSVVTVNVTILPLPNVTVIPSDATIFEGESLQLSASGAVNYAWYPSDSLSCDTCPSPIANPTETITYVVMGTDAFGCTTLDTIRIEVDIRCNEPFIPTIFSPNGKGPVANELLCLFSNCVDKLKFVVYNRWGEQVFETEDITKCWDGFYKDELAISGIYAYNLYILQLDGTVVNKKGTITLVK